VLQGIVRTEERDDMKPKTQMKSKIQDAKSAILCPVYFPFTFVSPSLVEAMSLCFHRVVVYQPAYSKPQEALGPWIERGFLEVRSPFEKVIDKKPLEAALRNFRSWGLLHQQADIAYLKMVGNDIVPVGPETPRIVSDIKAGPGKGSKESEKPELSLQLFLHLAQEFDEQSWELRQQLNRLNQQFQALQTSFREGQDAQAHAPISEDLFPIMGEDPGSFVIKKRMAAWNHLFQKDPAGPGLLFTDSPLALAYLLDEVQEKVEVLKFNISYGQAGSGNVLKDHTSWGDHVREILNTVLATPWSRTLQERVVEAGREIEAGIDHLRGSTVKPPDGRVSFRWYVVPHQVARNLLNRCCGIERSHEEDEASKVKNTLVGLIEHLGSSRTL
jgi:hypothetical protein